LGGHSVDDPEPKFGMVALGDVHPERLVTNAGARPGDVLVLTKPIGTGILTTALKRDLLPAAALAEAVASMTTLNAGASRAMLAIGVHAATDVTGFGLLGHLHTLLRASGVAADIIATDVPVFAGAREMLARGAVPGGTKRNLENLQDVVRFSAAIPETDRTLLADAQTSGGLLVAVAAERADRLREAMTREGTPAAAVIGRVVAGAAGSVMVR
jgi:selenide, water dikinase